MNLFIQLVLLSVMLFISPFYKDKKLWLLHTFIVLLPNNSPLHPRYNFSIPTTDIFIFIMAFILWADFCMGQAFGIKGDILHKTVLFFLFAAFLSFVLSHYRPISRWQFYGIFKFVLLYFYVRHSVSNLISLKLTGLVFILSGIVPSLNGIVMSWGSVLSLLGHYRIPIYLRAQGGFPGGAIDFTYYVVLTFCLLIIYFMGNRSFTKRIAFVFIGSLFILTLFVTFTRNGYLSLLVFLFTVIFLTNRGQILRVIGIGIVVLLLLSILPIPQLVMERFKSLLSPHEDASIMTRPLLWKGAIAIFKDHPIWGVGPGAFGIVFRVGGYSPPVGFMRIIQFASAHNLFLNTLADMGLIGFISLLYLLWIFATRLWFSFRNTKIRDLKFLLLGFISMGAVACAFGMSDFVWWSSRSGTLTGLILGMMAVAIKMDEKVRKEFREEKQNSTAIIRGSIIYGQSIY